MCILIESEKDLSDYNHHILLSIRIYIKKACGRNRMMRDNSSISAVADAHMNIIISNVQGESQYT
jgi:hypothetical protein